MYMTAFQRIEDFNIGFFRFIFTVELLRPDGMMVGNHRVVCRMLIHFEMLDFSNIEV